MHTVVAEHCAPPGVLRRGTSQLAFMESIAGAPGAARKQLPPPACSPGPDCCACHGCSWGAAEVLAEVLAEVAEVLCSRRSRRYMSKQARGPPCRLHAQR